MRERGRPDQTRRQYSLQVCTTKCNVSHKTHIIEINKKPEIENERKKIISEKYCEFYWSTVFFRGEKIPSRRKMSRFFLAWFPVASTVLVVARSTPILSRMTFLNWKRAPHSHSLPTTNRLVPQVPASSTLSPPPPFIIDVVFLMTGSDSCRPNMTFFPSHLSLPEKKIRNPFSS